MSDLIVPVIISDTEVTHYINNIRVLVNCIMIDLRAHNFVHGKTSFCARSVHTRHRAHKLSSTDFCAMYDFISYTIIHISLIIDNISVSGYGFRITGFIQLVKYFLMFHCLYYSITINESKGKSRIVFCCFTVMKNIVVPSFSSNFPVKLIYLETVVFVYLDKSIPVSL